MLFGLVPLVMSLALLLFLWAIVRILRHFRSTVVHTNFPALLGDRRGDGLLIFLVVFFFYMASMFLTTPDYFTVENLASGVEEGIFGVFLYELIHLLRARLKRETLPLLDRKSTRLNSS